MRRLHRLLSCAPVGRADVATLVHLVQGIQQAQRLLNVATQRRSLTMALRTMPS